MPHYYIPITADCDGSLKLRSKNLRFEAFPFDWNVKTIDSIYNLIKNNFNDLFTNKEMFIYGKKMYYDKYDNLHNDKRDLTPVYNKLYKILFIHDFYNYNDCCYFSIKEKYEKRIERFIKVIENKNNYITFIYDNKNMDSIYEYWNDFFEDKNIFNHDNIKKYDIKDLHKLIIEKYNNKNIIFIHINNI